MEDPDATVGDGNAYEISGGSGRHAVEEDELVRLLTDQLRLHEGCERMRVVRITPLDTPDTDGCNWSSSLVLDPAGVPPKVYVLAYASVVKDARELWNLK